MAQEAHQCDLQTSSWTGSGSHEHDGPFKVVAMEKEVQARIMAESGE